MLKKIKKLFLLGVKILSSLVAIVFLLLIFDTEYIDSSLVVPPTDIAPVHSFNKSEDSLRYDFLLEQFGKNKVIPEEFKLQALVALSYYPVLKETPIEFVLTDADASLTSNINPATLIFPWMKKTYVIYIDTIKTIGFTSPTLLKNLPYNAQIGVLGHELAHTVSYLDKSAIELAWSGILYLSSEQYVVNFENETEKRTIQYGLGYQLLSWSEFQYNIKLQEGKGAYYFAPEKIKTLMEKYIFYQKQWD